MHTTRGKRPKLLLEFAVSRAQRDNAAAWFAILPRYGRDGNSRFSHFISEGLKRGSGMVRRIRLLGYGLALTALGLTLPAPALAQANSPWESAVNVLQQAFTGSIARGLSLVAIVVSGLTFAFGEGGSKRVLAGVLFGVGMAIAAVNFLAWLFPG